MQRFLFLFAALLIMTACQKSPRAIDAQGHRGARGLLPENSLPAFKKALELDMTTLELDVVISADGHIVVSHEPFLSHEICQGPKGEEITEEEERNWNLYQMSYDSIAQCDCGSKPHPRFPGQEKMRVSKPLLSTVIDSAEAWARQMGRPAPYYNIETKSTKTGDEVYHPRPEVFADLLISMIREKEIFDRTVLQSFDVRTLQAAHIGNPQLKIALLLESSEDVDQKVSDLSFTPDILSPESSLVNAALVERCQKAGIELIPWTVNEKPEMNRLIDLGVEGIISDYPDRLRELIQDREDVFIK